MPTFTWSSHPVAEYMEYYQEGCYIPAYTDWGYLYYNQLYKYDFTQPIDPNSGLQPTSPTADCDIRVDDGVILYEAWHRSDRNAVTCYKCDQRMSIADFKQLPYLNDGSALANPPLPTIPDPGPPPP